MWQALEQRDQERIEAIIKRTEGLGEDVLGRIRVWRKPSLSLIDDAPLIHEILVVTSSRVFVERVAEETPSASYPVDGGIILDAIRYVKKRRQTDDRLEADENFAIPNSEITKVELKKFGWKGRGVALNIMTNEKEYQWYGNGLVLPDGWKTGVKLIDYETILRLAFPEKLSVNN